MNVSVEQIMRNYWRRYAIVQKHFVVHNDVGKSLLAEVLLYGNISRLSPVPPRMHKFVRGAVHKLRYFFVSFEVSLLRVTIGLC